MADRVPAQIAHRHRFVRAWLDLIDAPPPNLDRLDDGLDGAVPELRALAAAVAARGPQTLELERITVDAPAAEAIAAALRSGGRVEVGSGRRGRYQVDPGDGSVYTVAPGGEAQPSYDSLDDSISTNYSRKRDGADLGEAVERIKAGDAVTDPEQRAFYERHANAAIEAGEVGFMPVDDVPPATGDPELSPDGRWRLSCHPVRTRKLDGESGDAVVMLEGWYQLGGAWLADGSLCVLCAGGEVELDREDPEIADLAALDGYPGRGRFAKVSSSPLLHVVSQEGDGESELLYHIAVDAERVQSTPDGELVVLTRGTQPQTGAPRWRTAVLGLTAGGLAMLAKHELDIGDLRVDGDRVFGSLGIELVGIRAALAAAGAWRLEKIGALVVLEQPPPPPPDTLEIPGAIALERTDQKLPVAASVDPPEGIWSSWPTLLHSAQVDNDWWLLVRLHLAHAELLRMVRGESGWEVGYRLPVEGFDRVYASDGLLALSINNAPAEMAWSVWLDISGDDFAGRGSKPPAKSGNNDTGYLGRLDRVVTGLSGDLVELLGGRVYQFQRSRPEREPEARQLRAVVFDVPGHYGRREFLPRYDHDFGFIDPEGTVAISHRFTSSLGFDAGRCRATHCGPRLYGLIDRDGTEILGHHYNWIGEDRDGFRTISRGAPDILGRQPDDEGEWGLARSSDGEIVLPPTAELVRDMSEGRVAARRDGRWNLLADDGRWLLDKDVTACADFAGGRCGVAPDELWGFVDLDGAWVVEPRFEAVGDVCSGRVAVKLPGSAWRLADGDGQLVGDLEIDQLGQHHDGRSRARIGDKWGYVDASGEMVIAPRFDDAWDFCCGIAAVKLGDRWTWVDRDGELLSERGHDEVFSARDGFALFRDGARSGIVDLSGREIASGYEAAFRFAEGRALVRDRARWGYIDDRGEWAIEPRFSEALGFSEGLAAVKLGGKWGFVDLDGELVIEARLGTCGSFRDGRALVHR